MFGFEWPKLVKTKRENEYQMPTEIFGWRHNFQLRKPIKPTEKKPNLEQNVYAGYGRQATGTLCTKEQLEANYLTRIVNDMAPKAGLRNDNEKLLPKRWQRGAN